MSPVAIVTGGTSGIGLAVARRLSAAGYQVFALSRHGQTQGHIRHVACDVAEPQSIAAAVTAVLDQAGRIDLLVNNAGFGISGAVEFTEVEAASRLFQVDFLGAFACAQAVIPHMRAAGGGKIVNISSVAAVMPIPFQAFYSAAKAAINSLTMSLANEVRPFGIQVTAVMPGDVHTGFTAAREKSLAGAEVYGQRIQRAVDAMERDEAGGMSPDQVARYVMRAVRRKRPRPLYVAGGKYRLFCVIGKLIPASLTNRILGLLYGG